MNSDDSDFYGDEDTVRSLQERVDHFDIDEWIHLQGLHPGRALLQKHLREATSHLHNPYDGVPWARQLNETVDAFLERLPPRTTVGSANRPWIYICNPYIQRVHKTIAANQSVKGSEDEAPEEEDSKPSLVSEAGQDRLGLVTAFIEGMRKSGQASLVQEREINKERKRATSDILSLAHAAKVRAGKWMLFCQPSEVDEVWEIIAKATANNELGIAAKVAPKSETEDPRKDRLVCVYTIDFANTADVGRVLQRLRELRLVEPRGRPIYYKPDAFTYIGISSGNPWGLRASIYKSTDLLKH